MTDGSIKDWQLAASSALSRADDPQCAVKFARLHQGIAIACINFQMFFQISPFCFGSSQDYKDGQDELDITEASNIPF